MFMQMFFLKVHPTCRNIANGIKPGKQEKNNASKKFRKIYPLKQVFVRIDKFYCLLKLGYPLKQNLHPPFNIINFRCIA